MTLVWFAYQLQSFLTVRIRNNQLGKSNKMRNVYFPIANIQPIRLGNYRQVSSNFQSQMTLMSGWGRSIFSPANVAGNTRFAQFHVFNNAACRIFYPNVLETAQICAISSEPSGPMCPVCILINFLALNKAYR